MMKIAKKATKRSPKKKLSKPNPLEKATALYYASLLPRDRAHENRLGAALASASANVNFDLDN
jgi:hypothetical protein